MYRTMFHYAQFPCGYRRIQPLSLLRHCHSEGNAYYFSCAGVPAMLAEPARYGRRRRPFCRFILQQARARHVVVRRRCYKVLVSFEVVLIVATFT